MKTLTKVLPLVLMLSLTGSQLCLAQNRESLNSDLIRDKIAQLEKTEPVGRSAVVRDAYRQALIRLYGELDLALGQDINELRRIQSIAVGAIPDPKDAISLQIQKLLNEQSTNALRLKTIQGGSEVAAAASESSVPSARIISTGFGSSTVGGDKPIPSTPSVSPGLPAATSDAQDSPPPVVVCTDSNSYADAPELVTTEVDRLVSNLVEHDNNLSRLGQNYPAVFLYAVADAVMPNAENADSSIRQLKAYRYLAETARTDKQIGASAKSAGSTSAIEKPGFASLLGLAVEHGAILQNINSSTLTLSTSPYVLYTFNNGGDSAQNYARAGFLNRLGVSASFNMGDSNSAVLANAKRSQLSEWSARLRLFGDRSTRTPAFQKFWDEQIEPHIQARLTVIGQNLGIVGNTPELKGLKDRDQKELRRLLEKRMAEKDFVQAVTDKDTAKQKKILNNFVLCYLKQAVVDPVRKGNISLSPDIRTQLGTNFIRNLGESLTGLEGAREKLNQKLDDLSKSPLATLAYVNHRVPAGSDYSEIKFLYEQDQTVFRLLKLVGNVGLSLYNKPDLKLKQQRVRDFNASLSLEGKSNRPILRGLPDLSKITYAFTGSYERMLENKGIANKTVNLAAAQFKLEIPIFAGFSLPLSVTYTNGTEQTKKSHVRVNFGFTFDMDKVLALAKLLQSQQ